MNADFADLELKWRHSCYRALLVHHGRRTTLTLPYCLCLSFRWISPYQHKMNLKNRFHDQRHSFSKRSWKTCSVSNSNLKKQKKNPKQNKTKTAYLRFGYAWFPVPIHFSSWTCSGKQRRLELATSAAIHFCLSSPISSLRSLKLRRRNETLMVQHVWNARTLKTSSHTTFAAPEKSRRTLLCLGLTRQRHRDKRARSYRTAIKESGVKYRMSSQRLKSPPVKTVKLWRSAGWCSWPAAAGFLIWICSQSPQSHSPISRYHESEPP